MLFLESKLGYFGTILPHRCGIFCEKTLHNFLCRAFIVDLSTGCKLSLFSSESDILKEFFQFV